MSDSLLLIKFAGLLRSGVPIDKALKHVGGVPADREIRYLLQLCQQVGSAVANELEQVANIYSYRQQALERLKVNQAGPKASARLVIWLPLITLGLAQLSGLAVFESFLRAPVLLFSLSLGIVLLAIARLVSNRMVAAAQPKADPAGLLLLGVALASSGGAELGVAKRLALGEFRRVFQAEPDERELRALAEIEMLVAETGARVADLLRRQAGLLQRGIITESELVIEKLSVKLLLPLGLVVLPAFIFITLVPLMVSMLGKV